MTKIIINADDCGISTEVNQCIRHFIERRIVTSSTIMANMGAVEGAVALFKEFGQVVSFGVHLNLTQGEPLLPSQAFLDAGILTEKEGRVVFSGKFPYWTASGVVKKAAYKELEAQVALLLDMGVTPTHLDGHHHVHSYPSMLSVTPRLLKRFGIRRVRRMRNLTRRTISNALRSTWLPLVQVQAPSIKSTRYFASLFEYFDHPAPLDNTLELMCHPGGIYEGEEAYMEGLSFPNYVQLISYHDI